MKRPGFFLLAFLLLGVFGVAADFMRRTSASNEASGGAATKQAQEAPPSDPAARVAYEFLSAVLKGDDQRVSACLTPQAIERLIESHKRFALPGVDSTTFHVGEVRKPSESQALVQCILSDTSKADQVQNEEICCLVRQVDAEWRVSGIAFNTGPGSPPTIIDFENSPSEPMGLPMTPQVSNDQGTSGTSQRPSPARTADETPAPSFR